MIVAADSGSAILDENLNQVVVIACACIAAQYPFVQAERQKVIYVLSKPEDRDNILVEAKLCLEMALETRPKEVHLDISLGGARLVELSEHGDWLNKLSDKGKEVLSFLLPHLKPIAQEIEQKTGAKVLALGKRSPAVRIAELTAGAYGLAYAVERACEGRFDVYIGLPRLCTARLDGDTIVVESVKSRERCKGLARVKLPERGSIIFDEFDNPAVEGFKVVKVKTI